MDVKLRTFCNRKKQHPDYYRVVEFNDILTPITILLGPNGTGKTMSIMTIEHECKKNGINYIKYSNKHDDIVTKASWDWDPYKLACAFHSEGERITDSFFEWCNSEVLEQLLTNVKPIYVMIDELDSGLSYDKLHMIIHQWLSIINHELEKHPYRIVRFIFTCNSYEMLEMFDGNSKVLRYWVPTKQIIEPRGYKEFRKYYMEYDKYMNKDIYNGGKNESNDISTNEGQK